MRQRPPPTARRTFAAFAAVLVASPAARSEGIERLVAHDQQLIAIRDGQILTFAADGTRLGRCGQPPERPARVRRRLAGAPDAAEILHDAGWPDDDSTLEAEEALDDERGPEPRIRKQEPIQHAVAVPRSLAAGAAGVWAATSDGVLRVEAGGCRRVALPGRDLVAIAAGPGAIAAASAGQLFRAEGLDADRPETWPFRPVATLSSRPQALALEPGGGILVVDRQGVLRVGPRGETQRVLAGAVAAVAACDGAVMALASDGVFVWRDQRFVRAGRRPPVRALGCGDAPARRWLAGGNGLWASGDGAVWTELAGMGGALVAAVAGLPGRIWTITDRGLAPALPGEAAVLAAAAASCCDERPVRPRPRVPAWVWPTVTATLTVDRTATRRTMTGFVLFRFPFDRPPPAAGERSELALEWARREADRSRAQLAAAAEQGDSAAEEAR